MNQRSETTTQNEFVAYHPPKSASHGHGSKARNPRKAWAATQEFLSKHTNATLNPTIRVTAWGPSQWTDLAVHEQAIEDGTHTFGCAPKISGIFSLWELPSSNLSAALEFALEDEKRPKQQLGPVSLEVCYRIEWRDIPAVPRSANDQHFRQGSNLGISIGGRKCFIQPTLLFSLPFGSPELLRFLSDLEPDLPFIPKDEYFYRVVQKISGRGEKLLKLPRGWRNAT